MLVSLGMTMVIATRGIDISVGAVVPGPVATASFFDRIQDNPFLLPGAGAVMIVLGLLALQLVRRVF